MGEKSMRRINKKYLIIGIFIAFVQTTTTINAKRYKFVDPEQQQIQPTPPVQQQTTPLVQQPATTQTTTDSKTDPKDQKTNTCSSGTPPTNTNTNTKVSTCGCKAGLGNGSAYVSKTKCNPTGINVSSIYMPRPQGLNSAALFDPFLYGCNCNCDCAVAGLQYRYTQTHKGANIAKSLFGDTKLTFQGGFMKTRSSNALVAEWFGLDPLYSGTITFNPEIKQHMIDLGFRVELGQCNCTLEGAWLGLTGTLVHADWTLNKVIQSDETTNNVSKGPAAQDGKILAGYPGYMGATATTFATKLDQVLGGNFLFGDMQTPWQYGKFDLKHHSRKSTKLANVDLVLGYDLLDCDSYHLSAFVKASAPTGTKLDQKYMEYIFNPIIGNGHHWELGGGIDGHVDLWHCDDKCFGIYLTGSITHLFKNTEWRTFDFKNKGPLSRYMLLKQSSDPTEQTGYAGSLINAVNYTTRQIRSSFDVQGDASIRLLYQDCGWAFGVGYNIYGRSREKLELTKNKIAIDANMYGLKGNTGTHIICVNTSLTTPVTSTTPLNTTETNAPSLCSTSVPETSDTHTEVDNWLQMKHPPTCAQDSTLQTWDGDITPGYSSPAVTLQVTDLNKNLNINPLQRQIIHKVFAHIDHQWECCNWSLIFWRLW